MAYQTLFEKRDKAAFAQFALPVAALLIWDLVARNSPARLLLSCYLLAAIPFYLLSGSYPPFGSRWFWKAMLPITAIAALGVYQQFVISGWFEYLEVSLPARMAFGYTGSFAVPSR